MAFIVGIDRRQGQTSLITAQKAKSPPDHQRCHDEVPATNSTNRSFKARLSK
jgi:hypothetical protein